MGKAKVFLMNPCLRGEPITSMNIKVLIEEGKIIPIEESGSTVCGSKPEASPNKECKKL